ncbi:family 16 glycosylhydrolase, partial [Bacteroides fragilis]|nr:family 16 glycosylhydrolase [Bacteroides fragilis]
PRGDVAHAYYYKPNDTSVVWCEDGMLNLKFMKDETDPRGYKSGSIRTDGGKFDFTYGKVEVKAKFSSG